MALLGNRATRGDGGGNLSVAPNGRTEPHLSGVTVKKDVFHCRFQFIELSFQLDN